MGAMTPWYLVVMLIWLAPFVVAVALGIGYGTRPGR
jgi:hypothetical protein